MKTFSVKAILISFGLVANIDIVLIVKNLTYTLLKSFLRNKWLAFNVIIKEFYIVGIADIRFGRLCLQTT